MRRITAAVVVALALTSCSSASDQAGSTTTAPATTTTLPPATGSSTTLPPRAATEVDACRLLRRTQLEAVIEDPGTGEPAEPAVPPTPGELPALLLSSCSWPSLADPQLVLSYLAPTTAADGPSHLQDVLDLGTGFAEGGQVLSEPGGAEIVGLLLDDHEDVRELATVHGSALVYLVVNFEVPARDREQVDALKALVVTALSRAPR